MGVSGHELARQFPLTKNRWKGSASDAEDTRRVTIAFVSFTVNGSAIRCKICVNLPGALFGEKLML